MPSRPNTSTVGAFRVAAVLLGLGVAPAVAEVPVSDAAYRVEVAQWRRQRDERLRAPDGWLSLVGLHWLALGPNRFGGAPDDDVPLPSPVPAHAGTFVVEGREAHFGVRVDVPERTPVAVNGDAARSGPVHTDATPTPDVFSLGTLSWQVIERGARVGVRVRDSASPARRTFAGSTWYAIDPAYRVVARFAPHAAPIEIVVPDAAGGQQKLKSPGTLTFTLRGEVQHLDPTLDGDDPDDQMLVFRDATSAHTTYGAGRFVRALRQKDGTFIVDFNRAYAPPCAFTPYATCPLPPPQNRIHIAVEAGDKSGADHDGAKPPGHP
ncbi:MAG TPA: DUF1684 domain-containing protein [Polyangia bacterium]|nr:DUF1684 domain-containing protein [Polyangia bacterium]